jgi:hypothetical protein
MAKSSSWLTPHLTEKQKSDGVKNRRDTRQKTRRTNPDSKKWRNELTPEIMQAGRRRDKNASARKVVARARVTKLKKK